MGSHIKVGPETARKLNILKYQAGARSVTEIIDKLLAAHDANVKQYFEGEAEA